MRIADRTWSSSFGFVLRGVLLLSSAIIEFHGYAKLPQILFMSENY